MASESTSTGAEPKSPMWLPALGGALFLFGGVLWLVTPPFGQADAPDPAGQPAAQAQAAGDGLQRLPAGALQKLGLDGGLGNILPVPELKRLPGH